MMSQIAHPCINSTGFTTLYTPADGPPVADIVLVHGLQGSPKGTWSSAISEAPELQSTEPYTESQSDGIFGRLKAAMPRFSRNRRSEPSDLRYVKPANIQNTPRLHWPSELLPADCPAARILVWGYDSKITKGYSPANKSSLFGHAKDFLYSYDRQREQGRPILFVAHSLGGLIVKEALRRSQHSEDVRLQDIIECTASVIFMGTPHRGSSEYARLGEVARHLASTILMVDSNASILRALGLDSPELDLSRESFIQQWRVYNFSVKTFQESRGPKGLKFGMVNEKIVPDISSSLDDPRERAETLDGDHRAITKFQGPSDPNYIKVSGEMKRVLASIATPISVYEPHAQSNMTAMNYPEISGRERDALKTLAFSQMLHRGQNIREALQNTCGWFYSTPEYTTWQSGERRMVDHGLLWVKGKPGAGKSTIMKHVVDRVTDDEKQRSTVAAFYFNARGSPLERNPLGLLRSILHQICSQDRIVLSEFLKLYDQRQKTALSDDWWWSRIELENFIRAIFDKLNPRPTFIFIDALDECDEPTVREVVQLLASLGKSAFEKGLNLRICLSSRHYPTISIPNCPEVMVEGANTADIATYIRDKFIYVVPTEQDNLNQLESEMIEKSSGVFLWAVLVVDLLLQDINTGQPISVITERLRKVPKRMEDLYGELCGSLKPEEREFSLRLFQWVLFAKAMPIEDLCLAGLFPTPNAKNKLSEWDYHKNKSPPAERLERVLKNSCRGLLENRSGSVQFIHETVREFFLQGPGLGMMNPSIEQNPIGHSYEMLVQAAMDIIELPLDWHCLANLQTHCMNNILHDARQAEERDISMVPFLSRIETRNSKLQRLMEVPEGQSILYFMTTERLASCVLACLEWGSHPDDNGTLDPIWTPLIESVSRGIPHGKINEIVNALVNYGGDLSRRDLDDNTPFLIALKSGRPDLAEIIRAAGADIDAKNSAGECALHIILHYKAIGHSQAHSEEGDDGDMLEDANHPATMYEELFHTLLASGAFLETQAFTGSTPLHFAAFLGDIDSVGELLKYGARIDVEDERGSPLLSAASCPLPSSAETCRILLQHGADAQFKNKTGRNSLHQAAKSSTPETVKLLIEAGVDPNAQDIFGQTPCHHVVERRPLQTEIVRMLVDSGCSIMTRNRMGQTPLDAAIHWHGQALSDEVAELLRGKQIRKAATWEQ